MDRTTQALEIGCHTGATTQLIHEALGPEGLVIGVDISRKGIALARKSHPGATRPATRCLLVLLIYDCRG